MEYIPKLLREVELLPQIYNLRTFAWERSPDGDIINTKLYPGGWTDPLDATAIHWVIRNHQGALIASARLNVLNDIDEVLSIKEYTSDFVEISKPFAYMSRLVTHPDYRNLGISHAMDKVRIAHAMDALIGSMIGIAGDLGISRLKKLGFVERLSFLNRDYTSNPRGARSHLMLLDMKSRA